MATKKSFSFGPISASVEVGEVLPWETERDAATKALGTLDDGGWNALREVLRKNGFSKLYGG